MTVKDFRDLLVWRQAMDVAATVYRLTKTFPPEELFSLTAQLRRSAISVASNIAEGQGRGSDAEFGRFLNIARGSLCELQTQLLLAQRVEARPVREFDNVLAEVEELGRMLRGLQNTVG
ncbi:MAG TPA: four helix bundle protein [Burkholderiales bacterium]|nr:four helix bundle protein [Burkholderiales bacterium]